MMKIYIYIMTAFTFSGCSINSEECDLKSYEQIKLWPVNVNLKLPAYKIVDSSSFGRETILSYHIKSLDSLIEAIVLVTYEDGLPDSSLIHKMTFQKEEVEFGRHARKIKENILNIHTTKVGFLKYLIDKNGEKFYEGRIFFYRGNNFVQIWLFDDQVGRQHNNHSKIDCIAESLKLL